DSNTSGSLAGICRPRRRCEAHPPSWSPYTPTTSAKNAISNPPSSRVCTSATQGCSSLNRCSWASSLRHAPPSMGLAVFIMKADKISGRRDCDTVCSYLFYGLFGGEALPGFINIVDGVFIGKLHRPFQILVKPGRNLIRLVGLL